MDSYLGPKWEHLICQCLKPDQQDKVTMAGAEGWELIHVYHPPTQYNKPPEVHLYFKRRRINVSYVSPFGGPGD